MRFESGPSGYETPGERIELPYDDEILARAVLDPGSSQTLFDHDPVLWVRSSIGLSTERGASFVSDRELAEAHSEGGFAEWDPRIAAAVAHYLRDKGFIGLYGSSQDYETLKRELPSSAARLLARFIIEQY